MRIKSVGENKVSKAGFDNEDKNEQSRKNKKREDQEPERQDDALKYVIDEEARRHYAARYDLASMTKEDEVGLVRELGRDGYLAPADLDILTAKCIHVSYSGPARRGIGAYLGASTLSLREIYQTYRGGPPGETRQGGGAAVNTYLRMANLLAQIFGQEEAQ